jgi:hypothetical protein
MCNESCICTFDLCNINEIVLLSLFILYVFILNMYDKSPYD